MIKHIAFHDHLRQYIEDRLFCDYDILDKPLGPNVELVKASMHEYKHSTTTKVKYLNQGRLNILSRAAEMLADLIIKDIKETQEIPCADDKVARDVMGKSLYIESIEMPIYTSQTKTDDTRSLPLPSDLMKIELRCTVVSYE